jgi:SAM-dependent methyltransferase
MIRFLKRALARGRRSRAADPHLAPDGLPLPTPELHFLVSGDRELDSAAFWSVGGNCADLIAQSLGKHDIHLDECRAILDFGCGCGRTIRHFRALKKAQVYGTDYNPQLIDWCRRNLPFARFGVNRLHPPLAYGDGAFDVVYAFSVFTHLPEALQRSWLAELSRVLAPGGHLLMTTQGAAYADAFLPPHERDAFNAGRLVVLKPERAGTNECLVYHPATYVTGSLAEGLELRDVIPGKAIDLDRRLIAQDVYLLKKRR